MRYNKRERKQLIEQEITRRKNQLAETEKKQKQYYKQCCLCGELLPNWWEDVFYWGKDTHRRQCKYCGKCLTGRGDPWGELWGKCKICQEKDEEEKERRREEARNTREERERNAQAERDRKQQQRELEHQRVKQAEINQYCQLRKEIEAMPQYQQWRHAVLEKFGKRCAVCSSTENIEVDHRYKSFYAIVRKYGITNTIQAYECPVLWDVNNGAPLCKLHHDQTKSSIYHRQNNS